MAATGLCGHPAGRGELPDRAFPSLLVEKAGEGGRQSGSIHAPPRLSNDSTAVDVLRSKDGSWKTKIRENKYHTFIASLLL